MFQTRGLKIIIKLELVLVLLSAVIKLRTPRHLADFGTIVDLSFVGSQAKNLC